MKRLLLFVSLLSFAACGDFSTTIRETALTITPDRTTAATGQTFDFFYDAQGRSLGGMVIDYGDGSPADSTELSGAVTATGHKLHAYEMPGAYIVSGRLEELNGSSVEATVTVNVTGTSP
jgi:hypothetical protein